MEDDLTDTAKSDGMSLNPYDRRRRKLCICTCTHTINKCFYKLIFLMFCVEIISKLKKVLHTQLSSWSLFTQLLHFSFMISWNIYSYIFPLNHVDIAASIRSTNFPLLFHLVSSRTLLSNHFTVQTLSKSGQNPPYSLAFPVYPNEVPATHWTEPHVCPVSSTWPVPSHPLALVAQTAYKECRSTLGCTALHPWGWSPAVSWAGTSENGCAFLRVSW